jgi:hypothetical protein
MFDSLVDLGEKILEYRIREVIRGSIFIYFNYMFTLAEEKVLDYGRLLGVIKVFSHRNFPNQMNMGDVMSLLEKNVQPKYRDTILEEFIRSRFHDIGSVVHSLHLTNYIITQRKENLLDLILNPPMISGNSNSEYAYLDRLVKELHSRYNVHFLETILMFKGREYMFSIFDKLKSRDPEKFKVFALLQPGSTEDTFRSDLMTDLLREYIAKRALPY